MNAHRVSSKHVFHHGMRTVSLGGAFALSHACLSSSLLSTPVRTTLEAFEAIFCSSFFAVEN
jgi:hypothetical protein